MQGVRGDVYYYFTMGHVDEQQYELTGRADLATQAIESYKKALELAPGSPVIKERLAEIYAKSQHMREAVEQAQARSKAAIPTTWTRTGCWRAFTSGSLAI